VTEKRGEEPAREALRASADKGETERGNTEEKTVDGPSEAEESMVSLESNRWNYGEKAANIRAARPLRSSSSRVVTRLTRERKGEGEFKVSLARHFGFTLPEEGNVDVVVL